MSSKSISEPVVIVIGKKAFMVRNYIFGQAKTNQETAIRISWYQIFFRSLKNIL